MVLMKQLNYTNNPQSCRMPSYFFGIRFFYPIYPSSYLITLIEYISGTITSLEH